MGDNEHTGKHIHRAVEDHRQLETEGLGAEGRSGADVAERLAQDPDDQLSRPDQPDMSEDERQQFEEPAVERPIADEEHPEDR